MRPEGCRTVWNCCLKNRCGCGFIPCMWFGQPARDLYTAWPKIEWKQLCGQALPHRGEVVMWSNMPSLKQQQCKNTELNTQPAYALTPAAQENHLTFYRRLVEEICPALVHPFQEELAAGPGVAVLQRSSQVPAACPPWPKTVMTLHRFEGGSVQH